MPFSVNDVFESQDDKALERVLWIDSPRTIIVTIQLNNDHAWPVQKSYEDIEAALIDGNLHVVLDPFNRLCRQEEYFSENQRKRRDSDWELIEPLIEKNGIELFYSWKRGPLIRELAEQSGSRREKIYNLLRRYWQRGQMKNALIPDLDKCGAPGKERLAPSTDSPKRGAKSALEKATGQRRGVNITPDIKKKFERAYKLFFLTRKKRGFKVAYEMMLALFFNIGFEITNGVKTAILPPAEKLPSKRQFIYWYKKYRKIKDEIISREGERAYNLRHRPVLGESTSRSFGPGSIYQIDATIGDAYLVSSLNRRWVIGRPVIYFVIDVFSRMVVGLYIGLEGPNWIGAMMALANAMTDKVEFCREHDIPDPEIIWPCSHLCNGLVADRGELLSPKANSMVANLGIRILNTGACRGDWKGIVEQHIDLANEKTIHWVPGAVRWPRERGERDYRLDAVLTIQEFRKLLISSTIDYNLNQRLDNYPMDRYAISNEVERYPMNLWDYGIRRFGEPRTRPSEIIKLNLLPTEKATVTNLGIRFHGLYYECDSAKREGWFEKAKHKSWQVTVALDPRKSRVIYLPIARGTKLEVCRMARRIKTFGDCDLHEIDDYLAIEKQKKEAARTRDLQSSVTNRARSEAIISEAKEKTRLALQVDNESREQGTRPYREKEKERLRQEEAFDLAPKIASEETGKIIPFNKSNQPKEPEQEFVSRPSYRDTLTKLREEMQSDE